jgi:two-component system, NtrC family, response regulator AtoC
MEILIVEDDEIQRKVMYTQLKKQGHNVKACDSLTEARQRLAEGAFQVMFLDRKLPDGDGLQLLEETREQAQGMFTVLMTGYADVPSAIQAIRAGAYDYLPKPFEQEQIDKIIRNIEGTVQLRQRVDGLTRLTSERDDAVWRMDEMIGGEALYNLFTQVQRIAEFPDTTIMLLGESGTGKGMMAKTIHRLSPRSEKPFIDVNCSAIPGPLMESEIFGYERGAFTDAKNSKPGLLEIADGGTVFLDEIGDMDLALQAKLLKVIEDKQFRRLGGSKTITVDIRIIAATCKDLPTLARSGAFREDLYYRLSVFPLTLPALREHPSSIPAIADMCLKRSAQSARRNITGFSAAAMAALCNYRWPGNVRELRNAVERGVILCTEALIEPHHLAIPATPHHPAVSQSQAGTEPFIPPMSLAACEKLLISNVLKEVDGHRGKAADILQIHRSSLARKIQEYNLE